jgi:hypothetical protein
MEFIKAETSLWDTAKICRSRVVSGMFDMDFISRPTLFVTTLKDTVEIQ